VWTKSLGACRRLCNKYVMFGKTGDGSVADSLIGPLGYNMRPGVLIPYSVEKGATYGHK